MMPPLKLALSAILLIAPVKASLIAKSEWMTPNTVAFTETSPDYKRTELPSGRFKPETFAFAEGNLIDESNDKDASLQNLTFPEIADVLTDALKEADYYPTQNPSKTDLLIVVSWGKTTPHSFSNSMDFSVELDRSEENLANFVEAGGARALPFLEAEYENEVLDMMALQSMNSATSDSRLQANTYNATLLGYDYAIYRDHRVTYEQLEHYLNELEAPRYFVVFQVYDFQKLWKDKERELLCTTRFSIRAKGRQFDEQLRTMAIASASEFGKASDKLMRRLRPERVEFGELEYLGAEE